MTRRVLRYGLPVWPVRLLRPFAPRAGLRGWFQDELVERKVAQGQRQGHHDHPVQLFTGLRGKSLLAIDVLVALESLGCELENPGEHQGGKEADGQDNRDNSDSCITETKGWEDGLHHLDNQPRHHYVCRGYAQDIAALEFVI